MGPAISRGGSPTERMTVEAIFLAGFGLKNSIGHVGASKGGIISLSQVPRQRTRRGTYLRELRRPRLGRQRDMSNAGLESKAARKWLPPSSLSVAQVHPRRKSRPHPLCRLDLANFIDRRSIN